MATASNGNAMRGVVTRRHGGVIMESAHDSRAVASRLILLCLVLAATVAFPGCAAIAGIFKAGVWVGVVVAVVLIGAVVALISVLR